MCAVPALGGALSSAFGVLSSRNYVKLAKTAGREARQTIELASEKTEAAIQKAGDVAGDLLKKMGSEVRSSVEVAQRRTKEVLEKASQEAVHVISEGGIEARYTSEIVKIKLEQILSKASEESDYLMKQAGLQVRQSIEAGGKEARETCILASSELNKQINELNKVALKILDQGGSEVKGVLEKTKQDIRSLGDHFTDRSQQLIEGLINQIDNTLQSRIVDLNGRIDGLLSRVDQIANGLIVDLGEQGRLIIEDTGREIRYSANKILAQAFAGQEVTIKIAGEECRLVVNELGKEMRSTLCSVPMIASRAAEAAGRGFIFGALDALVRKSHEQRIKHHIQNLAYSDEEISVENLMIYLHRLSKELIGPLERFNHYQQAVGLFNRPNVGHDERLRSMLFIGVAALCDDELWYEYDEASFNSSERIHLGQELIKKYMPEDAKAILLEHGSEALVKTYKPAILPIEMVEEPNIFEIQIEQEKLKAAHFQKLLELSDNERMSERKLNEELYATVTSLNEKIEGIRVENEQSAVRLRELEESNRRIQGELEYVKQKEADMRAERDRLAETLNGMNSLYQ